MNSILIFGLFIFCIGIFLQFRFLLFVPKIEGLRILMYHKISYGYSDGLTVLLDDFEKQIHYLKKQGFQFIGLTELAEYSSVDQKKLNNCVLLTFDDAYDETFRILEPVLRHHKIKAAIMIPTAHIGKVNKWDDRLDAIIDKETICFANPSIFEFGLHSAEHINYRKCDNSQISKDIENSIKCMDENKFTYFKILAYPYGGFPRDKVAYENFKNILSNHKILFGMRIGNRINKIPFKDPFLLKRIDIKGTESFDKFKKKIKTGKEKYF